jgi:glycosyltransferase involved in cell wall biosynthesis
VRVAIDATALGSGQGGDESLVAGMLAGLAAVAGPDDVFPLVVRRGVRGPDGVSDERRFPRVAIARRPGVAHFAIALPTALARLHPRPELVCAFTHAPLSAPAPTALVVTDLSFEHHPGHYPAATRRRLRTIVRHQARRAQLVVTISEFSRSDLVDTYGLDPRRVAVVPAAVPAPPVWGDASATEGRAWLRSKGVPGRFVLCLGNLHPRKNVARLVSAFARVRARRPDLDDVRLVVAGARWWGGGEEEAAAAAPGGAVVFLGYVDDRRREQLLRLADALAYVSVFEGFGLPPLEAMARRTVVLASATTAVAETAGDGALLVDPLDTDAIAAGLVRVLTDRGLRSRLRARGLVRVAAYDVASAGQRALDAFGTALAGVGSATGSEPS